VADTTPNCRPASKWVAILSDRLLPIPRRVVLAKDIKHEAGVGDAFLLVRDHNSPHDTVFRDEAEIDLAEGNVFRVIPACEASFAAPCREPAKLAFAVDDAWKITINPEHTPESIRHLFALPSSVHLLRDTDSLEDQPISESDRIRFSDGPVFRTERRVITVKVNSTPVRFTKRRVSGAEIKETAAQQGATIPPNCVVYAVLADGLKPIADHDMVTLKECDEFRCVTTDDNS
jgi:hypothetical protein